MQVLQSLNEDFVLFLSLPGSNKNKKRNLESQIKLEMMTAP